MNEAEKTVRDGFVNTLEFLSSLPEQREFAANVHYDSYDDEFACWWFDDLYWDEQSAKKMFTPAELAVLVRFTETFDSQLAALGDEKRSIDELHRTPEWQATFLAAGEALPCYPTADLTHRPSGPPPAAAELHR